MMIHHFSCNALKLSNHLKGKTRMGRKLKTVKSFEITINPSLILHERKRAPIIVKLIFIQSRIKVHKSLIIPHAYTENKKLPVVIRRDFLLPLHRRTQTRMVRTELNSASLKKKGRIAKFLSLQEQTTYGSFFLSRLCFVTTQLPCISLEWIIFTTEKNLFLDNQNP